MDAYDSNYDDLSSTKAVMMENISSCDPEALSEESQDAVIQDTNSFAPNDLLLLSLVEQMTDHVAHLDKENQISKMEIDTLKQTLSNNVKEKESLSKTLSVFKIESKEQESKYIEKEIVLEKQNKELKNIISPETNHVLRITQITMNSVDILDVQKSCVNECNKSLELETKLLKMKDFIERCLRTKDSNKPLLTSTRVKPTTSVSGSKPSGNTKNNRITRPPSSNQKNKVEDHSRKVKSSLNKMNSVFEPVSNALVKHFVRNAKFESICAIYNKCLFVANHDMCIIDYVNDVNVRSKSKSKRNKMRNVWKPTGKVFTKIEYSWKPTGDQKQQDL
nr:hypothetical protein [Tanacetum cinerariifolium]